jgi:hypothetical protein
MSNKFKAGSSILMSGPSGCGKSTLATKLITYAAAMFDIPPVDVWWAYGEYTSQLDSLPGHVKLVHGMPNFDDLGCDATRHKLLIIDDLMAESASSTGTTTNSTRGCHHRMITQVQLVQNLFYKSQRTSRINSAYLFLLKSPQDIVSQIVHFYIFYRVKHYNFQLQVETLNRSMYSKRGRILQEAYQDATREPFGYLCLYLDQRTDERLRLRTNIFPDDGPTVVYVPKR